MASQFDESDFVDGDFDEEVTIEWAHAVVEVGEDVHDDEHAEGKGPLEAVRKIHAGAEGEGVGGAEVEAVGEAEGAGHGFGNAGPHGDGQDDHENDRENDFKFVLQFSLIVGIDVRRF